MRRHKLDWFPILPLGRTLAVGTELILSIIARISSHDEEACPVLVNVFNRMVFLFLPKEVLIEMAEGVFHASCYP
jgi:hypothetical protein